MKLAYQAASDVCKRKYIRLTSISNAESKVTFKDRSLLNKLNKDSIPILNLSFDRDESDYDQINKDGESLEAKVPTRTS